MVALRNGTLFALGMILPGAILLLGIFLRASDTWDRIGWEGFGIIYPAYVVMYLLAALASFAAVSLVWRRFVRISKVRLAFGGFVAGCAYAATALLLDPLWHEREFMVSWLAVAAVASSIVLLRPGATGA